MYDLIKNPNTNRYVNIHSNLGRSILRNYLYTFQIGGGKLEKAIEATAATTAKATAATTAKAGNLGAAARDLGGKARDMAAVAIGKLRDVDVKKNIKEIIQSGVKLIEESKNSGINYVDMHVDVRNISSSMFNHDLNIISNSLDNDLEIFLHATCASNLKAPRSGAGAQKKLKEVIDTLLLYLSKMSDLWMNLTDYLMKYGANLKDVYTKLEKKQTEWSEIDKKIKENNNASMMLYIFDYLRNILSLFANIKEKINKYHRYNNDSTMGSYPWALVNASSPKEIESVAMMRREIEQALENGLKILQSNRTLRDTLDGYYPLSKALERDHKYDMYFDLFNSVVDIQPGNKQPSKGNVK